MTRGPGGDVFATSQFDHGVYHWHADGTFVGFTDLSASISRTRNIVWAGNVVPEPSSALHAHHGRGICFHINETVPATEPAARLNLITKCDRSPPSSLRSVTFVVPVINHLQNGLEAEKNSCQNLFAITLAGGYRAGRRSGHRAAAAHVCALAW